MKKLFAAMLAAAVGLTCLAGCGESSSSSSSSEASTSTSTATSDSDSSDTTSSEDEYKVIRVGLDYDASSLDPQNVDDDASYNVIDNISEGLIKVYDGEVHPGIAESWDVSDDGLTYTFHLRESKWSDGTELTANDFVYAAKRALDPESAYEAAENYYFLVNGEEYNLGECDFEDVGVKAVDDYTLEYTLKQASATSLYNFSGYSMAPMNEAACEEYGITYGAEEDQLLTNGPFTVEEWTHESKIVIKKNENYWDADNVKLDEVQFLVGATGDTAANMFMADELDVLYTNSQKTLDSIADLDLEYSSSLTGFNFLHMNCAGYTDETAPFMSNVNFRKALSCAISRESILKIANVTGTAAYRLAPPTTSMSGKTWDEEYPLEGWSTTSEPEKAKEYLDAALEEIGCTVDEVPTLTMLCYDSQGNLDKLQAVQDMIYQTLGINCEISPQPIQQMLEMASSGQFDFWIGGKVIGYPNWMDEVGYEYANKSGSISGYVNDEFTSLFDSLNYITDTDEFNETLYELEKIAVDDMVTLHLYWSDETTVTVPGISDIKNLNGYGYWYGICDYVK